jgi:hypothetical protein
MNIKDIKSIELDRSKPFNHVVRIKDITGHSIQVIPVKESNEWEQFQTIFKAWAEHPDFSPEPPTEQELYERRK